MIKLRVYRNSLLKCTVKVVAKNSTILESIITFGVVEAEARDLCSVKFGNIKKPTVENEKLKNIVNDLYKGDNSPIKYGSGSTADAIRYEKITGEKVYGKSHLNKGSEYLTALKNWLKNNPEATKSDIDAANLILEDLESAIKN